MSSKIVVTTGASSGLGKELTKIYSQKAYNLILSGRNENGFKQFKRKNIEIVVGDLTSAQTLKRITDTIGSRYKRVDILINNAGAGLIQPFELNTDEQIDNLFEINVKSHMKLTQILFPFMKKRQSGHIINVISSAGMEGKLNHTVYCATKFALRGFTESLRLEAKRFNIKVTGVYPGAMKTHIFDNLQKKIDQSTFMNPSYVAKAIYGLSRTKDISPDSLVISRMHQSQDSLYDF